MLVKGVWIHNGGCTKQRSNQNDEANHQEIASRTLQKQGMFTFRKGCKTMVQGEVIRLCKQALDENHPWAKKNIQL